jgi:hypothetical protein
MIIIRSKREQGRISLFVNSFFSGISVSASPFLLSFAHPNPLLTNHPTQGIAIGIISSPKLFESRRSYIPNCLDTLPVDTRSKGAIAVHRPFASFLSLLDIKTISLRVCLTSIVR